MVELNNWNNTKQHWIPQFLLKGFGLKGRKKVWVLERLTGRVAVQLVKKIARKRDLVTALDDELMKRIEDQAAKGIDKLRKSRDGDLGAITSQDREAIDRLVDALIIIDPYSELEAKTRKDVIKAHTQLYAEAAIWQGATIDHLQIPVKLGKLLPRDYLTITMASGDRLVPRALRGMGLRAYRASKGAFILDDSPVLVTRGIVDGRRSLLAPEGEVVLPISSKWVLVYSWEVEPNVIEYGGALGAQLVNLLGQSYYHSSNSEYFFARDQNAFRSIKQRLPKRTRRHPPHTSYGLRLVQDEAKRIEAARSQQAQVAKSNASTIIAEMLRRGESRDGLRLSF